MPRPLLTAFSLAATLCAGCHFAAKDTSATNWMHLGLIWILIGNSRIRERRRSNCIETREDQALGQTISPASTKIIEVGSVIGGASPNVENSSLISSDLN